MGAERILRKCDGDESSEIDMQVLEKWTEKVKGRVPSAEKKQRKKKMVNKKRMEKEQRHQ